MKCLAKADHLLYTVKESTTSFLKSKEPKQRFRKREKAGVENTQYGYLL